MPVEWQSDARVLDRLTTRATLSTRKAICALARSRVHFGRLSRAGKGAVC